MLKKIFLGTQEIPVPVPLNTLWEALDWIEEVLSSPEGSVLTKLELNGKDVLLLSDHQKKATQLQAKSRLEVLIDSPAKLRLETLDAIKDLAWGIERHLQELAISCWQIDNSDENIEIEEASRDIQLLLDLVAHFNGLVDYTQKDLAPINGLARLVLSPLKDLKTAISVADWKLCSHILLNRLEPILKELVQECETLHLNLLSSEHLHSSLDTSSIRFAPHL